MMVFLIFLTIFALLNAWVAYRLSTLMRPLRRRRLWQSLVITWIATIFGTLIIVIVFPKTISQDHHLIPPWFSASIYIWHLLILPTTAIVLLLAAIAKRSAQAIRRFTKSTITTAPSDQPTLTRRRVLALSATAAIPPLATLALSGVAMKQLGRFRLKQYHLTLPGWPKGLDGFTMSVIADVHTGIFTTRQMLDELVDRSNNLRADVTLLAGDLINISLSDLPVALDMAMRLDSRFGVYMIQGNHDLIQDDQTFNDVCRRGANLLLDQIATLRPRGIPIQLLGAKWNRSDTPEMAESVRILSAARDPDLFPILLAHHPHTWDHALNHNLPLVISGHTHGGQIMLTDHIGGGPIRFKYWTGLYQKPNSTLVVSNGVGNWFPVRLNAPAEMLHITMHST